MTTINSERTTRSQMGFQTEPKSTYQQAAGDINFANDQRIYTRMPTKLLKNATIHSAILTFQMVAKTGGTSINRIMAHASGDSPMLRIGVNEWTDGPRLPTTAYVEWNATYPQTSGSEFVQVGVTSLVQELVNRTDWKPGGYITFIIENVNENGTDMGFRANHDFAASPKLEVNYTDPATDINYNFNLLENSAFDPALDPIDTTAAIPYWYQADFFNAWVSGSNLGTIARDTTFTRRPGVPTLRFTCGTPPAETTKRTGPITANNVDVNSQIIFAAWVFIPSYIPADVYRVAFGEYWMGMASVNARGTWVPIVTGPYNLPNGGTMWTGLGVQDFQAGWQFWISEPTLMQSNCLQMPFVASTPPLVDSGGIELVSYKGSASKQRSYREWTPRTAVKRNGVIKRIPRFTKRADGIFLLSEPVKGGPTMEQLPAIPISEYPDGKTIAEF